MLPPLLILIIPSSRLVIIALSNCTMSIPQSSGIEDLGHQSAFTSYLPKRVGLGILPEPYPKATSEKDKNALEELCDDIRQDFKSRARFLTSLPEKQADKMFLIRVLLLTINTL
jgi:hypothetical protein